MNIDDRISNYMALLNSETVKPVTPDGEVDGSQATAESPSVSAALSSATSQLADDEVRRERLNLIRQQLAEGSYNISGKDVADKILKVLKS